jgi:hypothetical protein
MMMMSKEVSGIGFTLVQLFRGSLRQFVVMAGLVPPIHVFLR